MVGRRRDCLFQVKQRQEVFFFLFLPSFYPSIALPTLLATLLARIFSNPPPSPRASRSQLSALLFSCAAAAKKGAVTGDG